MDVISHNAPQRRPFRPQRRVVVGILFLVVLAVLWTSDAASWFTTERVHEVQAYIRSLGVWGPVAYIGLCVVAVACFSPATPLLMIAPLFGMWLGTLYASIGLTAGASVSFLLARYTARPGVENAVRNHPSFARLDDGARRMGWKMVAITRLVPIFPFNLQNFAYGLTGIPFATYAIVSWLCLLPVIAIYVFAFDRVLINSPALLRLTPYVLAAGLLLIPFVWLAIRLRHRRATS
ncbi:MAG TPA: TVP38/TMEM64 family protein [Kiritimatiellia bacterium]|nr:TVP38/TMEM64 family protein [Kiritimatiellia bacterium]